MITVRAEMLARVLAATRPLDDDYEFYLGQVFNCFPDLDNDARLAAVLRAEAILREDAAFFAPLGPSPEHRISADFPQRCEAHADALVREFQLYNQAQRGRP